MEYFNNKLIRRKTRLVSLGEVKVGSDAPITVQSMTNTETHNSSSVDHSYVIENAGGRIDLPPQTNTANNDDGTVTASVSRNSIDEISIVGDNE